jgi:chromosome segregation ATPase
VVALARAEQKLIGLEEARADVNERLDEHESRLDKHEARLQDGDVTLNSITKVFWTVVTAALGAVTLMYFGK